MSRTPGTVENVLPRNPRTPKPPATCMGCGRKCQTAYCDACAPPIAPVRPWSADDLDAGPRKWNGAGYSTKTRM